MQGRESSSTTKATIGKGNISIDEILNDETKIANLNRDINNSEQNKRDVITSDFDAELKIDLRLIASVGNLAVGNTDKATANWDSYATQTVDGAKITKKIIPKIWASPNTAIGLAIGVAGYLAGKSTGKDVDIRMGENSIQFIGSPFGGGALTLGNVENYFGDRSSPEKEWPLYQYNDNSWDIINPSQTQYLGNHEIFHTYQAEKFGPFFLPIYLYQGITGAAENGVFTLNPVNKYNPMEQDADHHGNSLYMKINQH
jgi:hypothetical protein